MPKKEFAKIENESIKQILTDIGLPRKDIAKALNVTIGAIDKWLGSGNIPVEQLKKLEVIKVQGVKVFHPNPAIANHSRHDVETTLSSVQTEDLVDALQKRGWVVSLLKREKA